MLTRKNLVVDAETVRRLSARLRTTNSEAVRRAVDTLLLESTVMDAIKRLRSRGGIKDVLGRAPKQKR